MISEQQIIQLGYRFTKEVTIYNLNLKFYRHANGEMVMKDGKDAFHAIMPDGSLKSVTSIEQLEDIFDRLREE